MTASQAATAAIAYSFRSLVVVPSCAVPSCVIVSFHRMTLAWRLARSVYTTVCATGRELHVYEYTTLMPTRALNYSTAPALVAARYDAAHLRRRTKNFISHASPVRMGMSVGRKSGMYTAILYSEGKYRSERMSGWKNADSAATCAARAETAAASRRPSAAAARASAAACRASSAECASAKA